MDGDYDNLSPVRIQPLVRKTLGRDGWATLHRLAVRRGRRPAQQAVAMLMWALARAIEGADTELTQAELDGLFGSADVELDRQRSSEKVA